MSNNDMEFHLQTEIEVLERRLSAWLDKSRPEFRRMVERKQLLQKELDSLREARRLWLEKKATEAPGSAKEPLTHSEDYRSVSIHGRNYSLTPRQAQMVQILHEAHKNGNPDVGHEFILERIETPNSRWQDTFKSNRLAQKALIKLGSRRGTLRLNV